MIWQSKGSGCQIFKARSAPVYGKSEWVIGLLWQHFSILDMLVSLYEAIQMMLQILLQV
jgi:hypothetical protein